MNAWTLVLILVGNHFTDNERAITSVQVPGFSTEQACINAGSKLKYNLPEIPSSEITLTATVTCVSKDL